MVGGVTLHVELLVELFVRSFFVDIDNFVNILVFNNFCSDFVGSTNDDFVNVL